MEEELARTSEEDDHEEEYWDEESEAIKPTKGKWTRYKSSNKKVHDRMIIADKSDKVDDDYDYDIICD